MPIVSFNYSSWRIIRIRNLTSNGKWREVLSEAAGGGGLECRDPAFFPPILKACAVISFRHGTSLHASLVKQGLDSFAFIENSVVDFYAKSGALSCASDAFYGMRSSRDSVSWNVIIHGHLVQGGAAMEKGLGLFIDAKITGYFVPNISTLVLVIQAFRELGYLDDGLVIHAYLIRSGFWKFGSVQNSLLSMYADFGLMEFARKLFEEMHDRDVISWSKIIGCYVQNDEAMFALELFRQMANSDFGIEVDGQMMVTIFKACTNLRNIRIGKILHGFVICRGLSYDLFLENSLVELYSKSDDIESAFKVFCGMPQKNLVSWNSLLSGLVQNKMHSEALLLYESMQKTRVEADEITIVNLLQLFKYFRDPYGCKLIHSKVIKKGYESNVMVKNSLIDAYAKSNDISLAWNQFSQMKQRDRVTWNTMIAAFTQCGMPDEAILLFQEMNQVKEKSDAVSILNLIEACSLSAELRKSKWVHGICIRRGLASDFAVETAILDMYSKCGAIEASRKAFEQIPKKNGVSWTSMISAYAANSELRYRALESLVLMLRDGVRPNMLTYSSVLRACHRLFILRSIHCSILKIGWYSDVCLRSSLIELYSKWGETNYALLVFNEMVAGDLVVWNSILAGFVQNNEGEKALHLYKTMKRAGFFADQSTLMSVLRACTGFALLELGIQIHVHVLKYDQDLILNNSLLDMYCKCGSVEDANCIFSRMVEKDVISWSTMIIGLAKNGFSKKALDLFEEMKASGLKPNYITNLLVLHACSLAGLVEDGHYHFRSMKQLFGINPGREHYNCMVDLFRRAGKLDEAVKLIQEMDCKPDAAIWSTLLGACRDVCNMDLVAYAAKELINHDSSDAATCLVMAHFYASSQRWQEAAEVRKAMECRRIKKQPACSWIELRK